DYSPGHEKRCIKVLAELRAFLVDTKLQFFYGHSGQIIPGCPAVASLSIFPCRSSDLIKKGMIARKTADSSLFPHPDDSADSIMQHNRFLQIEMPCYPTYLIPRPYERTSKSCSMGPP